MSIYKRKPVQIFKVKFWSTVVEYSNTNYYQKYINSMLISWLKSMEMLKIIRINANHALRCNEATHILMLCQNLHERT